MSTVISAGTTTNTAYNVNADTSGSLVLATGSGPTTAVTISSSQVATFAQAPVLPSGSIPQAALASNVAGNGPLIDVYQSSAQSLTNGSNTLIQLQGKNYDTGTCFNNTSSTVTLNGISTPQYAFAPNVAGYYFVNVAMYQAIGSQTELVVFVYKNGSYFGQTGDVISPASRMANGSIFVYMNGTSDYIQMYGYSSSTGNLAVGPTRMQAALIRSA